MSAIICPVQCLRFISDKGTLLKCAEYPVACTREKEDISLLAQRVDMASRAQRT